MKAFKFSLQAVYMVRELELNQAEVAYAQALQACHQQTTAIEAIVNNIAALHSRVEEVRGAAFCAATQQHYSLAQTHALEALALQRQKLEHFKAEAEIKLKVYVEARKAFDGIAKIKERKYREHLKQAWQREGRELEDIFSHRYHTAVG